MENKSKSTLHPYKEVTVVPPEQYRWRFCRIVDDYFVTVPGKYQFYIIGDRGVVACVNEKVDMTADWWNRQVRFDSAKPNVLGCMDLIGKVFPKKYYKIAPFYMALSH